VTGPACLETREVWFAYEGGPPALRGISLAFEAGEMAALAGQNGSGKTTLAKHFNGLLRPDRGEVRLHGEATRDRPVGALARSVGYVFQNPDHQIFSPTTREEIAFGPRHLGLGEPEVRQRVEQALTDFGLGAYAERQPAMLGFGLRRKISVAAVYAMRTPILVLDEPTTGLDRRSTDELMQRLHDLQRRGHTIILITHDMRLIAEHLPRCVVLDEGQVLADGPTRVVFQQVELLRQAHLEPPQVTRLGQRLRPAGLRDDALTVPEFCAAYGAAVARRRAPGGDEPAAPPRPAAW
jgi:energy-coupling factor transporter ATP-binding protein EcfA2